jgi:hypothetical protein
MKVPGAQPHGTLRRTLAARTVGAGIAVPSTRVTTNVTSDLMTGQVGSGQLEVQHRLLSLFGAFPLLLLSHVHFTYNKNGFVGCLRLWPSRSILVPRAFLLHHRHSKYKNYQS